MLKKLINYLAIALLTLGLVLPAMTSAAGGSIISMAVNYSKGEKTWVNCGEGKTGDQILFGMKYTNQTGANISGLSARATLPAGLSYISGYSKVYYMDANGTKQVAGVQDSLVNGSGTSLGITVPNNTYAIVTYMTKVTGSDGKYAPSNQLQSADGSVALSANGGFVSVKNNGSTPTPVVTAPVTTNPTPVVSGNTSNTTTSGQSVANNSNVTLASSLYNITRGDKSYVPTITANKSDELIYRMTITNRSGSTATNLHARAVLPSGIEYVPGFSKVYWRDANGTDRVDGLNDGINGAGYGVILPDLPANHYFYVTYKVKVTSSAIAGATYAADNQVSGNNGLSLADNRATITILGLNGPDVDMRNLSLSATAKIGDSAYSNLVNAKRGDIVKFKIDFSNIGNTDLKNIKVTNVLPANLDFVKGSAKVVLGGSTISTSDSIITDGISLGDLTMGANGVAEFSAKVKSDTPSNVAQLVYKANATADGINPVSSMVTINLASVTAGGTTSLPDTGLPTTLLAIILLAMFIATAGYVYFKETKGLEKAMKLIRR